MRCRTADRPTLRGGTSPVVRPVDIGDDFGVTALDRNIREYYERGQETDRLAGKFPSGPLELARTQELILRHLPPGPLEILDVGGGPGVYAEWLANAGHQIRLVDPIGLHVEQALARHADVIAVQGDARNLDEHDGSFDVVLLLGPLYHLTEKNDRLQALREAHRVLRTGGLLFGAGISRYAAMLDLLIRLDRLHEPDLVERVKEAVASGTFDGHASGLFTTAYFHLPDELIGEVSRAGFEDAKVFNIEGPGFLVGDFAERWSDPARRDAMLSLARLVESEPALMGASSHLLVVART